MYKKCNHSVENACCNEVLCLLYYSNDAFKLIVNEMDTIYMSHHFFEKSHRNAEYSHTICLMVRCLCQHVTHKLLTYNFSMQF